jgi:hypothetical protein
MAITIDLRTGTNKTNNPIIGWQNVAQLSTASATSTTSGFPAIAALTYASYEGWKPDGTSGTFTLSLNDNLDYIGIQFIGSGTATIEYVYGATTVSSGSFAANGAAMLLFDFQSVQTIRVIVSSFSGYLANIMCGRYTELQRKIYVGHTPINYARNVDRVQGLSESGQFLGHIVRRRTKSTTIDVANLTPDYYRTTLDPFFAASTEQPHYWSYRRSIPQPVTDVDAKDQTAWAQVSGNPSVSNAMTNGMMSASWGIIAI